MSRVCCRARNDFSQRRPQRLRVGHYYYDARYNFLDSCDIAHLESHKNLFLTYVRSGTMYFETDQLYRVERGQIGLVDCRRPHHFYTKGDAEALWIHFDGANAAAFFEQILAFRGRRIYASSRSWHRSFPACAPAI